MPTTLPGRRVLGALVPLAMLAHCNLLARFHDCETDRDCRPGQMCNPTRHFCQTEVVEVCGNGIDDDFDGIADADEDFGPCEVPGWRPGAGCRDGVRRCTERRTLTCRPRTERVDEVCGNGVDDDCDGVVDDSPACMARFDAVTASAPMRLGSDEPGFGDGADGPAHPVCLAEFRIDRREVTFEAYARFLNSMEPGRITEGQARPMNPSLSPQPYLHVDGVPFVLLAPAMPAELALSHSPRRGWSPRDSGTRALPVVGVTWFGADAYCRWAGKHLPTEAEWWRAARGPEGTRPHPWGDDAHDCTRANLGVGGDNGPCLGAPMPAESLPRGRSPEGVYHLLGNANEWMFDWMNAAPDLSRNNYYAATPDGGWCAAFPRGPLGPDAGRPVVVGGDGGVACVACRFARGRDYRAPDTRIGPRRLLDPDRGDPGVGFRCATGGAAR